MPTPSLQSQILRIASELPVGDPVRRDLLAAVQREASDSFLWDAVDRRGFSKVYSDLRKTDEQSAKLLRQVVQQLAASLTLPDDERRALNRVMAVVSNPGMDPSLQRNNIFKAANSLGIKLPSGMF
jgi:hypothetical protein